VSYGVLANANTSLPSFQAKGDIVSQSAAGTLARLAVGTDGYVLTPLAGATTGLAYLPPNMGFSLVNGYLDFSVAASALTVAIKGFDGNDPSATNPVYVLFRSATAATGSLTLHKLTAATSVVVSSGSTLGATNSVAFRVWVVGYDDAGTFRLAVINCVSTAAGAGRVVTSPASIRSPAGVSPRPRRKAGPERRTARRFSTPGRRSLRRRT
jgi:hypothetical protein